MFDMFDKILRLSAQTSSGIFLVMLVILSRLLGLLEPLELLHFDLILKTRWSEPQDNRLVLIEIDSVDLVKGNNSKISAEQLTQLINQLQAHQPAVIGFNILSDLIDDSDKSFKELSNTLSRQHNIVVAETITPPFLYPLPGINQNQVGFVDIFPDRDDVVRRMMLGSPDFQKPDQFKFSFSLLLAKSYLEQNGYILSNGEIDQTAMQFNDIEIPRTYGNTGGYSRIDDAGIQTVVNYRKAKVPFKVVNLENLSKKLDAQLVQNKIVIIGITDSRKRLRLKTPVNKKMDGLHMTAHFTSYITSAAIDGRPLVRSWKEIYEYIFIMFSSIPIIWMWRKRPSPSFLILTDCTILFFLFLSSYILLVFYGYWLAVVPPTLILCLNLLVYLSSIYQNEMRRKVIERTFDIIHNGPLQSLSIILNDLRSNHISYLELESKLKYLSRNIREIGDALLGESLSYEQSLFLDGSTGGDSLNLNDDLHELFHQIYSATLKRDFHNFNDIRTRIRSFDFVPIAKNKFSLKREFCRFLEEAICNVGRHSVEPTQLIVTGKSHEGFYILTIKDNGIIKPNKNIIPGQGTRSAARLARKLKGKFKRECLPQKGTTCELKWRL